MFQQHGQDDDEELILGDEPPKVDGDPGASEQSPASKRASRAAAQRSKAKSAPAPKKIARSSSSASKSAKNPYRTRSAAQIRAEREATRKRSLTDLSEQPRAARRENAWVLDQAKIAELLSNPTRHVSEQELRQEYGYVVADLRNMGLLALGLVIVLLGLAQVLPR